MVRYAAAGRTGELELCNIPVSRKDNFENRRTAFPHSRPSTFLADEPEAVDPTTHMRSQNDSPGLVLGTAHTPRPMKLKDRREAVRSLLVVRSPPLRPCFPSFHSPKAPLERGDEDVCEGYA